MERFAFRGFDHVDARVRDLAAARPLYDALLPALGLTEVFEHPGLVEWYQPLPVPASRALFGLREDAGHVANETCIAFSAATAAEVDRLADIVRRAGARDIEGPEIPYSYERYYAVFFRDASGNRMEICYRRAHEDRTESKAALT